MLLLNRLNLKPSESRETSMVWLAMAIGAGYVVGIGALVWILFLSPTNRKIVREWEAASKAMHERIAERKRLEEERASASKPCT